MNKPSNITPAPVASPCANADIPAAYRVPLDTLTACPDCDGPLSHRIIDEDTGCSYPVDDGEHYCEACDSICSDEPTWDEFVAPFKRLAAGWNRVEL